MTKDEVIASMAIVAINKDDAIYLSLPSTRAVMDEYAKQQAIAFVKYNCPDLNLDDTLLNAGYAGFLINQEQQNKE